MFEFLKSFKLWVDRPRSGEISTAICVIDGWFAWKRGMPRPALKMNGTDAAWVGVKRPDVKRAHPGRHTQGFRAVLDTSSFASGRVTGQLVSVQLVNDGKIVAQRELRLMETALEEGRVADTRRRSKREWLQEHLICPMCPDDSGELDFRDGGKIFCARCKALYADNSIVFDFLPQDLRRRFRIEDAEDVSAHQYDDVAIEIVEEVRRKNGRVLDCGSGMRPCVDDTVICLDVAPLPSVDVLAVNQKLPFKNASFDAVLSLNVLEHVLDPFGCAAELVRVLKPGGTLYCCIPFLQPEHGYPHHYFNATRSGLRELFPRNWKVLQHVVPRSGEPVWTLRWFLSWYSQQLPRGEKRKFLGLRVKDILEQAESSVLDQPWVDRLSEEGKWKLASTTAAVFRKPLES